MSSPVHYGFVLTLATLLPLPVGQVKVVVYVAPGGREGELAEVVIVGVRAGSQREDNIPAIATVPEYGMEEALCRQ